MVANLEGQVARSSARNRPGTASDQTCKIGITVDEGRLPEDGGWDSEHLTIDAYDADSRYGGESWEIFEKIGNV